MENKVSEMLPGVKVEQGKEKNLSIWKGDANFCHFKCVYDGIELEVVVQKSIHAKAQELKVSLQFFTLYSYVQCLQYFGKPRSGKISRIFILSWGVFQNSGFYASLHPKYRKEWDLKMKAPLCEQAKEGTFQDISYLDGSWLLWIPCNSVKKMDDLFWHQVAHETAHVLLAGCYCVYLEGFNEIFAVHVVRAIHNQNYCPDYGDNDDMYRASYKLMSEIFDFVITCKQNPDTFLCFYDESKKAIDINKWIKSLSKIGIMLRIKFGDSLGQLALAKKNDGYNIIPIERLQSK
jgi:hypothetical protein